MESGEWRVEKGESRQETGNVGIELESQTLETEKYDISVKKVDVFWTRMCFLVAKSASFESYYSNKQLKGIEMIKLQNREGQCYWLLG